MKGQAMTDPRLIYLMGPSGAGKDAVLSYARARIDGRHDVTIAHRYVTRQAEAGHEDHVALSAAEFEFRRRKGLSCSTGRLTACAMASASRSISGSLPA